MEHPIGTGMTPELAHAAHENDVLYSTFLKLVDQRLHRAAKSRRLFSTVRNIDSGGKTLWDVFIDAIPAPDQREWTCSACRRFILDFGHLATIDIETGAIESALWHEDDAHPYHAAAVEALRIAVRRSLVTGPFYTSEDKVWGKPRTGPWSHLAVTDPPASAIWDVGRDGKTAGQMRAEKAQDFETVSRCLDAFHVEHFALALQVARSDTLYRSEKVLGQAQWLHQLAVDRALAHAGTRRDNTIWRAVADAPAGFCHPRSSMIGTLLDDLETGMPFAQVAERFAQKMHPLSYQRPTEAPKAGNILAGQRYIDQIGAARSFRRRRATLADLRGRADWLRDERGADLSSDDGTEAGLFANVEPRQKRRGRTLDVDRGDLPVRAPMTFAVFKRDVLPEAEAVQVFLKRDALPLGGLLEAADPTGPAILQWDSETNRNTASWYLLVGGVMPEVFGLKAGAWAEVTAVSSMPFEWGEQPKPLSHFGKGMILVLDGAVDPHECGSALFPEILRADLREFRATIESYSRSTQLEPHQGEPACGLILQTSDSARGAWNVNLRVRRNGIWQGMVVDRAE